MSLGILLGITSTYLLFRPIWQASSEAKRSITAASLSADGDASSQARSDVWWAALIGSFYCIAGVSAILYPGTNWFDPEHAPEGSLTQGHIFSAQVVVMWLGWWLESRRLSPAKGKAA